MFLSQKLYTLGYNFSSVVFFIMDCSSIEFFICLSAVFFPWMSVSVNMQATLHAWVLVTEAGLYVR